jgi:tyrosine-protein phosphatase YwqE
MFSFLKRNRAVKPDLSFIGADMHSHLLPGLDDGLPDMEKTLLFVRELSDLGYKKLICTPHIMSDLYPNGPETIIPTLHSVQEAISLQNIPVTIGAAAEYMVDTEMEAGVNRGDKLLTFGNNFILIEMSYLVASPNIDQVIFALRVKGLKPVIAHPERYTFYHTDFKMYERFVDLGCLLQMNLLSLSGYYGKPVKAVAEKLLASKMISLVGTDMHHEGHLFALKDMASRPEFYKAFEGITLKNSELL